MNMKEKLIQLRKRIEKKGSSEMSDNIIELPSSKSKANDHLENNKEFLLEVKIDEFIQWYSENLDNNQNSNDLRNFIEKVAVWYELRYPDFEIPKFIPCCAEDDKNINEIMFQKNQYVQDKINKNYVIDNEEKMTIWASDLILVKGLKWDEFYSVKSFINALPWEEKFFISRPKYKNSAELLIDDHRNINFSLTHHGCVESIDNFHNIHTLNNKYLNLKHFIGKTIQDVLKILIEEYHCTDEQVKKIKMEIQDYENKVYFKEQLLNCIMYRIIERGHTRFGSRRAFLFAQEFHRNIDIPMMYGIDSTDPYLINFINLYLKCGGSRDLVCIINYHYRKNEEKLKTSTLREIIKIENNKEIYYTPEEKELYQRLVNVLSSQVNQDELLKRQQEEKKEEVKQLRLERKFGKNYKRKR